MVCLYCNAPTQVSNSRWQKRLNQTWRRRVCEVCKSTLTTHEAYSLSSAIMVRDGALIQPFSRDRLFISIYESCKHRSDAIADADALTHTVIAELLQQIQDGTISRSIIVQTTHDVLHLFDTAAATIYRAYHSLK